MNKGKELRKPSPATKKTSAAYCHHHRYCSPDIRGILISAAKGDVGIILLGESLMMVLHDLGMLVVK